MKCCVSTCNNSVHKSRDLSFFRIPDNRTSEWLEAIGLPDDIANIDTLRICENHFLDGFFKNAKKNRLTSIAIPTINLAIDGENVNTVNDRMRKCRETKKKAIEAIEALNKQKSKYNVEVEPSARSKRKRDGRRKANLQEYSDDKQERLSRTITLATTPASNNTQNPNQSTSAFKLSQGNITLNIPKQQLGIPSALVPPFNDAQTRASTFPGVAPYSQQSYQQIYQNTTQLYQTGTRPIAPNNIMCNIPVHPDVEFKKLPFYDHIAVLIKPSALMPKSNARKQEHSFYFHLTPQQALDIALSREECINGMSEYFKQVQMRFCLMETTCQQEDFFPPELVVKVNNKCVALPNPAPAKQQGVSPKRPPRPLNITQLIKLTPTSPNIIHVEWLHEFGRGYAIAVTVVHKKTSAELLTRMKLRGAKHSDITRGMIKEKLREDADNEIATTSLRVSLICPLGRMRMTNPCRAKTCTHLQCFDASLYLQMNERKPSWLCPVCDKPTSFEDIYIDGYFQMVLNAPEVSTNIQEIQLNKDGSWSVQNESKHKPVAKPVQLSTTIDDCVEIIDDEDLPKCSNSTPSTKNIIELKQESTETQSKPPPVLNKSVVDLTLSDSEDDQPLSKIRAMIRQGSTSPISDTSLNLSDETPATPTHPLSTRLAGSPVCIISLDSPTPPTSPALNLQVDTESTQPVPASSVTSNSATGNSTMSPVSSPSMPLLDAECDATLSPDTNDFY